MSIITTRKKSNKNTTGWDEGIKDAKAKIRALRNTIKVYTERKKSGEPWPGSRDESRQQKLS
jgi:hypothetical protein